MAQNQKHEQEMLEQMLKYASAQSLEALYDEYADETTDDSQPSEQLDNAVMQMLADAREKEQQEERARNKAARYRRMLRRLAAAVALVVAIGAVGGMLVMNVEAWRVPFLNFLFDRKENETFVQIAGEESILNIPPDMLIPTYLPEGFSVAETGFDDTKNYIIYRNEENSRIIFTFLESDGTTWKKYADQEKKEISINGMAGYLVAGDENIEDTLIWGMEESVYVLVGDVTSEELIKIAESVR